MGNDLGISIGLTGVAAYNASLKRVEGKTATSMRGVGTSIDSASTSFKQLATQIPGVGTAIALLSNPIGAVIASAAALTGIFTSFVGTAAKFESQLATVGALAGLDQSTEGFKALNEEAQRLGATTEFSATQAAQAMEFLVRAGFDATETLAGTADTLSLATVGALDLARASDIATDTLSQFQLPVEELGRVVDVISKTTVTANTNVTQFADAMNYLGPTAQALGISLEESSAAIGILSSSGLKGSLATRALGTSLVRLTKPTAEAAATLEKFNIEAFDDNGDFVGLAGLVGQLETSFAGLTQEQEQAALASIFGAEAIQEINILLGKGSSELAKYTAEIEEAGKQNGQFAQGIRDIKLDTFEGAVIQIKSAFEALKIELTDGSLPVLKDLALLFADALRGTVSLIDELGSLPGLLTENAEIIGIAAGALVLFNSNAILLGLQSIPNLVTSLLASSKGFLAVAANSNIAIGAQALYITGSQLLRGTITAATAAQRVFNVVFAANPVALIATGVIALASALLLFKDRTEETVKVSRDFSELQGKISAGYTKERAALDALFKPLRDNAASNEERSNAITAINEQYKDYLPNLITEKSSAEDLAIAYEAVNRAIIDNITTKAIQERAASVLQKITEVEIDRATKLLELEKEINAEVANGGVASGFNLREIEIQASAGQSLDDLFGELEAIDEAGAAIGESLQNSLSGIDFSNIFSATKKTVEGLGGAEKAAKTLADQLSDLGVSLPAFEEFEGLTELSDQTEEVKEKANEARRAIVALGEEPNASVSVLRDQISNLRQAISLLPPEAAGIRAITDEVVRLELQLLEVQQQIERTFLATKIDNATFEIIPTVSEIVLPEIEPLETRLDLTVNVPPIGDEPFVSLQEAARILDTDIERLNNSFGSTAEILDVMNSGAYKVVEALGATGVEALELAQEFQQVLGEIGNQVINDLSTGFAILGEELANVTRGTQSVSGAFDAFGRETLAMVLESGTRIAGTYLMQLALGLGPAGIPVFVAGAALAGLSGFLPNLLLGDQGGTVVDTPEFSGPNLNSTSVPTGPSLATDQQSAFGLSDLNQDQGTEVKVQVVFGTEDVTDFFSIAFQTEKELTG